MSDTPSHLVFTWCLTQGSILQPLTTLVRATERIAAGDYTFRLNLPQGDEIGTLAGAFNVMSAQVQHTNQAIRLEQNNLAITLDAIGDAVIVTDANGFITRMNPVAERLTGWPLAAALNQPLTKVFHIISAQTRLPLHNPVQRVMEHGKVLGQTNPTALLARDGQEYQIINSAAPIRDATHTIVGVVLVFSDVSDRYRAETALHESETFSRAILDSVSAQIAVLNGEGVIVAVNAPWQRFAQEYSPEPGQPTPRTGVGCNYLEVCVSHAPANANDHVNDHDDNNTALNAHQGIQAVLSGRQASFILEYPCHSPDEQRWFSLSVTSLGTGGQGVVVSHTNITERHLADMALKEALREKTALLRELHHRVKNNLQVVTSLLRLEGFRTENDATKTVLNEMQGRIRAMALLHETIYRKGSFAAIDLGNYIGQIAGESLSTLLIRPGTVQLQLEMDTLQVGLDQATPCGLMMSELMSNCLKHGFPEGQNGKIAISLLPLDEANWWRLTVSDTGIGLPADFESKRGKSLGLQLVGDLAVQMGGNPAYWGRAAGGFCG